MERLRKLRPDVFKITKYENFMPYGTFAILAVPFLMAAWDYIKNKDKYEFKKELGNIC